MAHMHLIGFADYRPQAQRLAAAAGLPYLEVALHRFPDGESRVQLPPAEPGAHWVVCRSLDHPNDKLVELLLLAQTAREMGVARLSLVAPYLCYMRQDIAFHPGEAVSQRHVGALLGRLFDDVVTVDPHLHRIDRLEQAVPARGKAICLSATEALTRFVEGCGESPLLLGPDAESAQWVERIAAGRYTHGVARKRRHGDRDIELELPTLDFGGRTVVIVDDMISTGTTVARCAAQVRAAGATRVVALCTHALFAPGADTALRDGVVDALYSTDSVAHASNAVELAPLLAAGIAQLGGNG